MRNLILGLIAVASLVTVAAAQAPSRARAEIIQTRQAGYKAMAPVFKSLFEQTRASEPNIETIRANTAHVARTAALVGRWFPRGSGPETGIPTRAKAEIWTNVADFRARAATLVVAARRIDAAARSGDVAAVRAAFPALRQACADCHERYRGPEL